MGEGRGGRAVGMGRGGTCGFISNSEFGSTRLGGCGLTASYVMRIYFTCAARGFVMQAVEAGRGSASVGHDHDLLAEDVAAPRNETRKQPREVRMNIT